MIVKDPVYGYIHIAENKIKSIVDTPNFQRLRDIVQTNYFPLYPSSIHNRFAHSLGVYHLGEIAVNALCDNFTQNYGTRVVTTNDIEEIKNYFLLACLLHDIGHAPFSHTGEDFYLEQDSGGEEYSDPKLIVDLDKCVNDKNYTNDRKNFKQPSIKAHEYMSAYLGVKIFLDKEPPKWKNFFVRCIVGVPYYTCSDLKTQLMNACISLLNSTTIDVDKLDYLLRDGYMMGYNTVSIDYERLLQGVSFNKLDEKQHGDILVPDIGEDGIPDKRHHLFIAFKKSAISVLENVILANDLERKWLQSHPVVIYGTYLLQVIINELNTKIAKVATPKSNRNIYLFSYDSLIDKGTKISIMDEKGTRIKYKSHIRYLSDSDILYLAKNVNYDEWSQEYFSRKLWRHPVWKSEAEFKIAIEEQANKDILIRTFNELEKDYQGVIKGELLKMYEDNYALATSLAKQSPNFQETAEAIQQNLRPKINLLKLINEYCDHYGCEFDFVVKTTQQFTSGMSKEAFKKIPIQFDKLESTRELQAVSPLLDAKSEQNDFFYLYHNEKDGNKINIKEFCNSLAKFEG